MGIAVDGIVSGLDTTAIIDSLVAVYSIPKENLEATVDDYEDLQEKLTSLMSYMDDLGTALENISESTDFRAYTASSSDETTILATATGEAIAGAYSVEIDQLATSEMEASQSFDSYTDDETIKEGTYEIIYGDNDPVEFAVESGATSLQDMVDTINDEVDGVTAFIIDNGDPSTPYQVILVGEDTGSTNSIQFNALSTSGSGSEPSFTETQAAQDAMFTVNGVDVVSESNTASDTVPGLEMTLTQETSSPVTVTVTRDTDTMVANLQAFVDAYNEVVDYIDTNSVYNYDAEIRGAFVGESTIRRVSSSLSSAITDIYSSGDSYNALSLMGIELDSSGILSLDEDAFTDALDANFDEVEALFTADDGFAAAMLGTDDSTGIIDLYVDDDSGTLQSRYDSLDDRIDDLEDQIEDYEARIERYEERLRAQYEAMEVTLGLMETTTSYLEALLSDDSSE